MISRKHSQQSLSNPEPSLPDQLTFTENMNIMKNPKMCTVFMWNLVKLVQAECMRQRNEVTIILGIIFSSFFLSSVLSALSRLMTSKALAAGS